MPIFLFEIMMSCECNLLYLLDLRCCFFFFFGGGGGGFTRDFMKEHKKSVFNIGNVHLYAIIL